MPQNAREIDDEAADWAARLDGLTDDAATNPALDVWLAGDPRRAGALLRAQAALSLLDRGRALSASEARPAGVPKRRLLAGGGAALLAASIGGLAIRQMTADSYRADLGEIRRVQLADGSSATLNTETALQVRMERSERKIRLDRGEAWFKVAKNPGRPFVVTVDDIRVQAVGTAFSVRRQTGGALVQVTEGVVEVWRQGGLGPRIRVAAGSRVSIDEGQPPQPIQAPAEEIEDALAWRQGLIAMRGMSLGEAAAEFNRYNRRKLIIDNADLAAETVVGRFRTDEPDAFAGSVAIALDARVEAGADIILIRRQHAAL